jgi:hypothetical protein
VELVQHRVQRTGLALAVLNPGALLGFVHSQSAGWSVSWLVSQSDSQSASQLVIQSVSQLTSQ